MNYFTPTGDPKLFFCTCCHKEGIQQELVDRLNKAREIYGKPMRVTSGVRCSAYNSAVGGAGSSSHVDGNAADIYTPDSFSRLAMLKAFIEAGFRRIGISNTFIHVDISLKPEHPQDVAWLYGED